ncbi:thiol reductant ABC exporter subunit CydC [Pelagibacterium halotolerans]|uniref:Transport ATP-binding protein CydC n=1 Tax=Pelagibacterium halotolerans (strain DSM 22347 / JCM 15775 / CGMCC 1.7692 / B2) TaxID=1082931 RepID=G4R7L5_PELHB|nr:thiol reductant ABC exporter subunit CydC [Pelagibacterium halotolerans]AEQ52316.1 transport ATP-binding protein CydC [Pelagibacterium halotolerans B2]QJR17941.1 thiol reductant ABC exporter subunit CydC [Pelagibacterium halotolerans]SEA33071.1 ATP-binding cassette, subfamily C, CydC [Pelagibacterium halotolerans]
MKSLLFFAPLFRPHARRLALALLLSLVTLAAGTALLGVSGWFLTATALTALGVSFNLFAPSSMVRGFSFIRILSRYFEKLVGHNATLTLLSDLRRWLFGALFPRLPLADRSLRHGDLVTRMSADIDALDTIFLIAIGPFLAALVLGGALTAVLFFLLPGAAWIYLGAIATSVLLIPTILARTTRTLGRDAVEAAASLRGHVLDAIAGHDDLIAFGQAGFVAARFNAASKTLARLRNRQGLATSIAAAAVQIVTAIALLAIVVIGLNAVQAGIIGGPVFAGIVFAALGSFEATAVIVRSIGKLGAALASAERLHQIATAPIAITDPARPVPFPATGAIAFEAVTFSYPNAEPVLSDLSLTAAPGEHIAISGPSGAGKSSLLHLLLRLYDPQAGAIRISGIDIRDIAQADLHAHIALLSQQSPVFLDTVRNNLLIARPDATDAELYAALRNARLETTIRALPHGLDTILGETGTTLSAGQARRLCLARTLLAPAPIVLLDEPTAGLDRETELALLADFPNALAGRTVLLATHALLPENTRFRRLALTDRTLREADQPQ